MKCTTVSRSNYRDRVIEYLADQERALARDLASTRELLHLALGHLHEVTRELGRLRERHYRLHDEYRSLRERPPRKQRRVA